ncbi:hypothetical protein P7K49_007431 [Saguinus oedipus]|uniref:Uncharacterized protein n=1 Tax=Saguinus oedipus TaxID=9490 RepID=A0ABQ9VUX2_SAGOE|nr:hypothetical protein P7K49_007431 [Saguinus oedipus]
MDAESRHNKGPSQRHRCITHRHIPEVPESPEAPHEWPSAASLGGCGHAFVPAFQGRHISQQVDTLMLTGYGIHHCFARSMMGHEVKVPLLENFYADYYTTASIALVSCLAMCLVVRFLGRRGGLLLFMILTALASLLQLGLLNYVVVSPSIPVPQLPFPGASAPLTQMGWKWQGPQPPGVTMPLWPYKGIHRNPEQTPSCQP